MHTLALIHIPMVVINSCCCRRCQLSNKQNIYVIYLNWNEKWRRQKNKIIFFFEFKVKKLLVWVRAFPWLCWQFCQVLFFFYGTESAILLASMLVMTLIEKLKNKKWNKGIVLCYRHMEYPAFQCFNKFPNLFLKGIVSESNRCNRDNIDDRRFSDSWTWTYYLNLHMSLWVS